MYLCEKSARTFRVLRLSPARPSTASRLAAPHQASRSRCHSLLSRPPYDHDPPDHVCRIRSPPSILQLFCAAPVTTIPAVFASGRTPLLPPLPPAPTGRCLVVRRDCSFAPHRTDPHACIAYYIMTLREERPHRRYHRRPHQAPHSHTQDRLFSAETGRLKASSSQRAAASGCRLSRPRARPRRACPSTRAARRARSSTSPSSRSGFRIRARPPGAPARTRARRSRRCVRCVVCGGRSVRVCGRVRAGGQRDSEQG